MGDVTRILEAIDQGDPRAAEELLPLVYDELRRLAAQKLSHEKPGQTLQATALVHEAYIRLVGTENQLWDGRGHFFAAAAEAMRRILVENARCKGRIKHGGCQQRIDLEQADLVAIGPPSDDLLALNDALERLAARDKRKAELVSLRYFAGLTIPPGGRNPRHLACHSRTILGLRACLAASRDNPGRVRRRARPVKKLSRTPTCDDDWSY